MGGKIFQDMQEVHYCQLESQSNIYGLAKYAISQDENKILVASLRGKIMSVAFHKTTPSSREVTFTYIPGDAEVISIDAFYGSNPVGIVVAIAFVKISEGKRTNYLNIYSEWENGGELDLDRIAQGCQSLDLSFVPYMLYHAEVLKETVFLMSGDDFRVHMFREAKPTHRFDEEPIESCFPELADLPGIVIWLHCVNVCDEKHRITAVGCQNGFVVVRVVDIASNLVVKSYQTEHDCPISSVQLFTLRNQLPPPDASCVSLLAQTVDCEPPPVSLSDYHLLVTSSLELAVVYTNVIDRGLADILMLPDSDAFDTVNCALVTDIDFDGKQEIILGTYGQELLVYKFQARSPANDPHTVSSRWSPPEGGDGEDSRSSGSGSYDGVSYRTTSTSRAPVGCSNKSLAQEGDFFLITRRSLPDPVLALDAVDMTGDGIAELVVLSHTGLHIFQHDLKATAELCLQRLQKSTGIAT